MLQIKIIESKWVSIVNADMEAMVPYWCKQKNGDIVMAAYYNNGNTSGMVMYYFDDDGLKISSSNFHILEDAMVQKVIFE